MPPQIDSTINIFAYGSNMCTGRIQHRVPSATPLITGYVSGRRLAFHKRGRDGSAKADAAGTNVIEHRVWGVVYRIRLAEKPILDECEQGYHEEPVVVQSNSGALSAQMYVARHEFVDVSLKPFHWYRQFVVHGAIQHQLPTHYVKSLESFESVIDPDPDRTDRNSRILIR